MVPSGSIRTGPPRSSTPTAAGPAESQTWEERIEADEIGVVDRMRVTSRLERRLTWRGDTRRDVAVAAVDALAQATELKLADVELLVDRYQGRRGMKAARAASNWLTVVLSRRRKPGLRLLLMRAGFPRPQTQIAVRNEWGWVEAYLDMGWEDIKVGRRV